MAEIKQELVELAESYLGKGSPQFERVLKLISMPDALKTLEAMNRAAFMVADEACAWAEMILRGAVIQEHVMVHRKLIDSASAKEYPLFNVAEAGNEHLTNFDGPKVGETTMYFVKAIGVGLDADNTLADMVLLMRHMELSLTGPQGKKYIDRRPIRTLPSGRGLDGTLNNGVPGGFDAMMKLRRWIRFGPGETPQIKLAIPTGGTGPTVLTKFAEVELHGFKAVW